MFKQRQMMGRMVRVWLASVLVLVGLLGASVTTVGAETGDCDNNAVIRCGAYSLSDLKQKYKADQGSTQAVYRYFGINNAGALNGMVNGRITKDAKILVDGKVVATNAMTAGREDKPQGSTPILGGKFYKHAAGANMAAGVNSLQAFVKMDENGRFMYAVMKSCGNPVSATPKQPKPQPQPQPVAEQPTPSFTVQKDVRVKGQTAWSNEVRLKPGEHIEYRVTVTNNGQTDFASVNFREQLPVGITYVVGNVSLNDKGLTNNLATGMQIDQQLSKNQSFVLVYEATVSSSANACVAPGLINTVFIKVPNLPEKSDTAVVYVCVPASVPQATVTPVPPAPVVQAAVTPTRLVDTGPTEIITAFLLATVGGMVLYRLQNFYKKIL